MQDEITALHLRNRIAKLHKEIKYRDTRIEELEQELLVKDEIIRKQVILLSEKVQHGSTSI